MKDEEKILRESMKSHQKAIDKAEKELEKLKEREVTYSIGDRFKTGDNKKAILGQINSQKVAMFSLHNGLSHSGWVTVNDKYAITEKELRCCCTCNPIRYWDSRKQVHV